MLCSHLDAIIGFGWPALRGYGVSYGAKDLCLQYILVHTQSEARLKFVLKRNNSRHPLHEGPSLHGHLSDGMVGPAFHAATLAVSPLPVP